MGVISGFAKEEDACRLISYKTHKNISICATNAVNVEAEENQRIGISSPDLLQNYEKSCTKTASVVVRNACLEYKTGHPILSGLNMTVESGSIYSLLGSSGCGKTSLLMCILGMKKLKQGDVWVFNEKPQKISAQTHGSYVGYMPQDISLYEEFTISETLRYFGTFSGMTEFEITSNAKFFGELLELPCLSRRINTMSGGQKRRLSFALALLHNPQLLILDEPTVGVDPLLCEKIWSHLIKLVTQNNITVIITTHYIEEARNAHMVGIIKDGRIISEMPPQQLISLYSNGGVTSLEKAVLELCRKASNKSFSSEGHNEVRVMSRIPNIHHDSGIHRSLKRVKALTEKNFVILLRNFLLLAFMVCVPAIQALFLAIAYGYEPAHLNLGVLNQELNDTSCPIFTSPPGECNLEYLGCVYLSHVPKEKVEMVPFHTEQDAVSAVHLGSIWGYIIIPSQFSFNMLERTVSGVNVNETVLNSSTIVVKLDETNKQIILAIKVALYDALNNATTSLLSSCGFDPRMGLSPLKYNSPVHGKRKTDLREFTLPGVAITSMVFFPVITIGIRLVNERKCGLIDRSLIAGVRMWEISLSYLFSEFFLIVAQELLVFGVVRFMSDIHIVGSVWLCLALLLLLGYCGISLGFLFGTMFNEEIEVAIVALGTFLPNLVLSGILWPIQGMPVALQYVVKIFPSTLSAESIRSIIFKGWGFTHEKVWPGFVIVVIHILVYSIVAVLIHRHFRRK